MRREVGYPVKGFVIGFAGGGIFNLLTQYFECREAEVPFWENVDWERTIKSSLKVGAIGGAIGYVVYLSKWTNINN